MKVYVATSFLNREAARQAIRQLRLAGHAVVGDWTGHAVEGENPGDAECLLRAFALEDFYAVQCADALVLLHDERGRASFTELGIALGHPGQMVIVVGGAGSAPDHGPIFYALPWVYHFPSLADAIAFLGSHP